MNTLLHNGAVWIIVVTVICRGITGLRNRHKARQEKLQELAGLLRDEQTRRAATVSLVKEG